MTDRETDGQTDILPRHSRRYAYALRGKNSPKRAWSRSRDRFRSFKLLSIFLEWMRLRCLTLASGSTTACPTERVKMPLKGHGLDHVIVFGMKPRSLNFVNASTMASATTGVKNP